MVQPHVSDPSPRRSSRLTPWMAALVYVVFVLLMLFKQYEALQLSDIGATVTALVATTAFLLILLPWFFIRPGKRQVVWAFVLDLVLTLIAYADVLYFRQFGDLTSVATLRFAGQLGSVGSSVAVLIRRRDVLLFFDIPILLLLCFIPSAWFRRAMERLGMQARQFRLRGLVAVLVALVGAGALGYTLTNDNSLDTKWIGHTGVASRLGLLNYHAFDIGSYGGRMIARMLPSDAAVQEVEDWFADRAASKASAASGGTPSLFGVAQGKNVIVIQMESFQALPLNLKINGQEITPNLNRLAQESLYFRDAYSQTGQGVTSDADLLTNCSLYPTRTGAVYYDYANNDFLCMPEVLRNHGYTAVAMQGIRPDFWNLAAAYPQVGFEQYFSSLDFDMSETIGLGLSDESFFQQAVDKLKSLPEPYYAFLVTLTSHGPFNFESIPHTLQLGDLEGTEMGNYLHAVHYTDEALGHFLDRLKEEGILDNAVLVVYGDHYGVNRVTDGFRTPSLLETLGLDLQNEVALQEAERRIPLMIRLPGGQAAAEQTQVAGQVDIAPTVAGLLGISTDDTYFMGQDLLSNPSGLVAFYTGSALDKDHLFLSDGSEGVSGQCFSRQTGQRVEQSECESLADEASTRLYISRLIVERNLIPDLEAGRAAKEPSGS